MGELIEVDFPTEAKLYKVILQKDGSYRATQICRGISEAQSTLIRDIETIEDRRALGNKAILELLSILETIPASIERGDYTYSIIEWSKDWPSGA